MTQLCSCNSVLDQRLVLYSFVSIFQVDYCSSYASSSRSKSRTFVPFLEQIMHMMDLKPLVPKFWKYLIRAVPSALQIPRAIPDQPLG